MRAFKIILIVLLAVFLSVLILGVIDIYLNNYYNTEAIVTSVFMVFGIVFGLLSMLYHIKNFRYYRTSKRKKKSKKISIFLWFGTIISSIYFLFIGVFATLGTLMHPDGTEEEGVIITMFIAMFILTIYGIFSILETSLLKKRIKKLREELSIHDEINEIGS